MSRQCHPTILIPSQIPKLGWHYGLYVGPGNLVDLSGREYELSRGSGLTCVVLVDGGTLIGGTFSSPTGFGVVLKNGGVALASVVSQSDRDGYYLSGPSVVEGCTSIQAGRSGFTYSTGNGGRIIRCRAVGASGDPGSGFHVEPNADVVAENLVIAQCTAERCRWGIAVQGSGTIRDLEILECFATRSTDNGIQVRNCHRVNVRGCHAIKNGRHGLAISGREWIDVNVRDNFAIENQRAGVLVARNDGWNSEGCDLSGNVLVGRTIGAKFSEPRGCRYRVGRLAANGQDGPRMGAEEVR